MGINLGEGLLIAGIAVFFFGGKRIPELGRTLGQSMKGFKEGMSEPTQSEKEAKELAEKIEADKNKKG